ncbi:unnamed protein product [Owenia fusiformis]|uniref:2-oxo-4-hydroxy-4-carboxy-5-ureidoimidazoline decarboxylase n=1 Tax=Owenia fusiformis TaxID=6347 RepID=A0A8J1TI34_OWEFU|nr:unnamed protein product [Owenia fusiformis]
MSLSMDSVNAMGYDNFINTFRNVVEHCPLAAASVWADRPFSSEKDLGEAFGAFLDSLSNNGKEGVLRLHPDLAGRIAKSGTLSKESSLEQSQAGLLDLTEDEQKQLGERNKLYQDKFGFPFVICVRENKKNAIIQGIKERLEHTKEEECEIGVENVKRIALLRIHDIFQ